MTYPQDFEQSSQFDRYGAGFIPNLTVEISSRPLYRQIRRQGSGMTPMESIEFEGTALDHLSHGNVAGWVAIASWFVYGIPMGILVFPILGEQVRAIGTHLIKLIYSPLSGALWFQFLTLVFAILFTLMVCLCTLTILAKGTIRKLQQHRQNR